MSKKTVARKDNLTDVATQITDKPQNDNTNTPSANLADNQVIGNDGTVIDLNIDSTKIRRK